MPEPAQSRSTRRARTALRRAASFRGLLWQYHAMALIEGVDVEHRGSGPDLVILHSLLAERSAFDRVAPALSRTRRVWLVNLPGYGASRPAGTSVEDYAGGSSALLKSSSLTGAAAFH